MLKILRNQLPRGSFRNISRLNSEAHPYSPRAISGALCEGGYGSNQMHQVRGKAHSFGSLKIFDLHLKTLFKVCIKRQSSDKSTLVARWKYTFPPYLQLICFAELLRYLTAENEGKSVTFAYIDVWCVYKQRNAAQVISSVVVIRGLSIIIDIFPKAPIWRCSLRKKRKSQIIISEGGSQCHSSLTVARPINLLLLSRISVITNSHMVIISPICQFAASNSINHPLTKYY